MIKYNLKFLFFINDIKNKDIKNKIMSLIKQKVQNFRSTNNSIYIKYEENNIANINRVTTKLILLCLLFSLLDLIKKYNTINIPNIPIIETGIPNISEYMLLFTTSQLKLMPALQNLEDSGE